MGLNAALATASRSFEIFSAGIQVAGQNIANANTPGYIREELQVVTNEPYKSGSLIFGTGAYASGIVQQIDLFLETRIHGANSEFSAADAKEKIYKQLEATLRELGEDDLSTELNNFLSAINDAANQPELAAVRQLVVQAGTQVVSDISFLRFRIDDLRRDESINIDQLVNEANELIDQIADLNTKIVKQEGSGLVQSDAGGLRTLRYNALNRLSEIMSIKSIEREDGSVDVLTGTDFLVLTGQTQKLETVVTTDRNVLIKNVRLSTTKSSVTSSAGGELGGILEGRDVLLGGFVDDLDAFASNFIFEFNKIHSSGDGLIGFSSVTSQERIADSTAALSAAGLAFTPKHGSFQLKVTNTLSDVTETTNITIDLDGIGTDTSLQSLQASLDAIANVSASITTTGQLKIDADANFDVRFLDDTSGVLAALGINTFFTGADSSDIGLNSVVANDHRFVATATGGGPSDNSNAVKLAEFLDNPVAGLGSISLDAFYNRMVVSAGQASAAETAIADGLGAFRESLQNQRMQFSGVSLDEEAVTVLQFQRSFQAAARLVSMIDELFTILLSV
jgi:flagellar hook-associated protein 1 FlgK